MELSAGLQQAANQWDRSQCLRLGAVTAGMEAYTGASPHQPRCYLCSLGSLRDQVRSRFWCSPDPRLLLRRGGQLVGLQAHQEAHPLHHHLCILAPQLCLARCRIDRWTCSCTLFLCQGRRRASRALSMGGASTLQYRVRRVPEQHCRLGPQRCLLSVG